MNIIIAFCLCMSLLIWSVSSFFDGNYFYALSQFLFIFVVLTEWDYIKYRKWEKRK